ncbi:cholesterol oxidase substrate-binding domain-containing protein [Paracoccus zhejiangensis]|uniref:cholesterol oxidase substrate-binding domain-containing protein n=1 Tax=Paracoccus zhejiangensis TaxID=1077935 RepID=UPI0018E45013|nr:cholesterol oxidase substrate-binding domain-containing protein [Paracoccus zhejiangensis]
MATTSAPAGFPANIPVSLQTYENWAQMISVPNVWTCIPATEADVVAVCNWAAQAKFTVRARGVAHGWSPLTVTEGETTDNVMLVDLRTNLNKVLSISPASAGSPAQVTVQTGCTMLDLMTALETSRVGPDPDVGFSFAHIPAPGNLTVGGVLAINGHGTGVRTPPRDDMNLPYGSLSNQILGFTAIVTRPVTGTYAARRFSRGDPDAKAFLTHCGRALLTEVTLQVTDNYMLRCQSFMNIPATTLFAQPVGGKDPARSVGDFLQQSGRIEVIWFPAFDPAQPSFPWFKVWTVSPKKPTYAKIATGPYNYPFSDDLPSFITALLRQMVTSAPEITPTFCSTVAQYTAGQLTSVADLWGKSKNTLLYVKDETLRVTANGYAVLMKRDQVQQAIADATTKFTDMLLSYQKNGLWPINSPLEIRVTGLDDTAHLGLPPGQVAESPVISSLGTDPIVQQNGWDVACWFDVLTIIPEGDPQQAYQFYTELETWFYAHFDTGFRANVEWSKGWAYSVPGGAWTDAAVIQSIRDTCTTGRPADATWAWQVATLQSYDAANLFTNPFLDQLFTTGSS